VDARRRNGDGESRSKRPLSGGQRPKVGDGRACTDVDEMTPVRSGGKQPVSLDRDGERRPRQRDDDLDELARTRPRRCGCAAAREGRKGGGDGDCEWEERAAQSGMVRAQEAYPADAPGLH
jgi:hypothetical protein